MIPALQPLNSDATLEEIREQLAILQKTLTHLMTSNLSSANIAEIGGWTVDETAIIHETGAIGLSSEITGADDIRIWAGDSNRSAAPFRVYASGKVVAGNLVISGGEINWENMNGLIPQERVDGLPTRLTRITATGIYTGTVTTDQLIAGEAVIDSALIESLEVGANVTMGPNAFISWGNVTSQPFIPKTATDVGAVENSGPRMTYIDAYGVYTGTVDATKVIGTYINVGETVKMSTKTFSGGVVWGDAPHSHSIYIDPATNLMTIKSSGNLNLLANGIYHNSQPFVGVFG